MASRVYVVFEDGKEVALVRAKSGNAAILYITTPKYEAIVADGDAMFKLGKAGFEIKDADAALMGEQQ